MWRSDAAGDEGVQNPISFMEGEHEIMSYIKEEPEDYVFGEMEPPCPRSPESFDNDPDTNRTSHSGDSYLSDPINNDSVMNGLRIVSVKSEVDMDNVNLEFSDERDVGETYEIGNESEYDNAVMPATVEAFNDLVGMHNKMIRDYRKINDPNCATEIPYSVMQIVGGDGDTKAVVNSSLPSKRCLVIKKRLENQLPPCIEPKLSSYVLNMNKSRHNVKLPLSKQITVSEPGTIVQSVGIKLQRAPFSDRMKPQGTVITDLMKSHGTVLSDQVKPQTVAQTARVKSKPASSQSPSSKKPQPRAKTTNSKASKSKADKQGNKIVLQKAPSSDEEENAVSQPNLNAYQKEEALKKNIFNALTNLREGSLLEICCQIVQSYATEKGRQTFVQLQKDVQALLDNHPELFHCDHDVWGSAKEIFRYSLITSANLSAKMKVIDERLREHDYCISSVTDWEQGRRFKCISKYKCELCGWTSMYFSSLRRHMLKCSRARRHLTKGKRALEENVSSGSDTEMDTDSAVSELIGRSRSAARKVYCCIECDFEFIEKEALRSHVLSSHSVVKPIQRKIERRGVVAETNSLRNRFCQRNRRRQFESRKFKDYQLYSGNIRKFSVVNADEDDASLDSSINSKVYNNLNNIANKTDTEPMIAPEVNRILKYRKKIREFTIEKPKNFDCPNCDEKFYPYDKLLAHLEKGQCRKGSDVTGDNANSIKDRFQCGECGEIFKREMSYNRHVNSKQCTLNPVQQNSVQEKKSQFQCSDCNVTFKAESYLNWHRNSKRCEINLKKMMNTNIVKPRCPECGTFFISQIRLDKHRFSKKCQLRCKQLSRNISSVQTEQSLICSDCYTVFESETDLEAHKQSEECAKVTNADESCSLNDIRTVECPDCNEKYKENVLGRHRYSSVCKKNIERKSYTYKCDICTYSTSNAQSLGKHMKIHASNKCELFCCSSCGYLITIDLDMNQDKADGKYVCSDCEYRTASRYQLKIHHKSFHTKEGYKCVRCGYSEPPKGVSDGKSNVNSVSSEESNVGSVASTETDSPSKPADSSVIEEKLELNMSQDVENENSTPLTNSCQDKLIRSEGVLDEFMYEGKGKSDLSSADDLESIQNLKADQFHKSKRTLLDSFDPFSETSNSSNDFKKRCLESNSVPAPGPLGLESSVGEEGGGEGNQPLSETVSSTLQSYDQAQFTQKLKYKGPKKKRRRRKFMMTIKKRHTPVKSGNIEPNEEAVDGRGEELSTENSSLDHPPNEKSDLEQSTERTQPENDPLKDMVAQTWLELQIRENLASDSSVVEKPNDPKTPVGEDRHVDTVSEEVETVQSIESQPELESRPFNSISLKSTESSDNTKVFSPPVKKRKRRKRKFTPKKCRKSAVKTFRVFHRKESEVVSIVENSENIGRVEEKYLFEPGEFECNESMMKQEVDDESQLNWKIPRIRSSRGEADEGENNSVSTTLSERPLCEEIHLESLGDGSSVKSGDNLISSETVSLDNGKTLSVFENGLDEGREDSACQSDRELPADSESNQDEDVSVLKESEPLLNDESDPVENTSQVATTPLAATPVSNNNSTGKKSRKRRKKATVGMMSKFQRRQIRQLKEERVRMNQLIQSESELKSPDQPKETIKTELSSGPETEIPAVGNFKEESTVWKEADKSFSCNQCEQMFTVKRELLHHTRCHVTDGNRDSDYFRYSEDISNSWTYDMDGPLSFSKRALEEQLELCIRSFSDSDGGHLDDDLNDNLMVVELEDNPSSPSSDLCETSDEFYNRSDFHDRESIACGDEVINSAKRSWNRRAIKQESTDVINSELVASPKGKNDLTAAHHNQIKVERDGKLELEPSISLADNVKSVPSSNGKEVSKPLRVRTDLIEKSNENLKSPKRSRASLHLKKCNPVSVRETRSKSKLSPSGVKSTLVSLLSSESKAPQMNATHLKMIESIVTSPTPILDDDDMSSTQEPVNAAHCRTVEIPKNPEFGLKCARCEEIFTQTPDLIQHIRTVHINSTGKKQDESTDKLRLRKTLYQSASADT